MSPPVPEIINGSPGSGKTSALLSIVEEELNRGVPPDRIAYLSFTRKAAHEAIDRACVKFTLSKQDFRFFSTIHSLCFRQLGKRRGDILEGSHLRKFGEYAGLKVTGRAAEDGDLASMNLGDRALFMENLARARGIPLRDLFDSDDDNVNWSEVWRVAECLKKYKAHHGLCDFTDLLEDFVNSDVAVDLEVLLVDEMQDLSFLQHKVIDKLAQGCRRIVFSFDDDQAIFSWSGADVDRVVNMKGDEKILGHSWRCPVKVQELAASIIANVGHRREKKWTARKGSEGVIERVPRIDDADADDAWDPNSESPPVLVLARNTYILREQVEPELKRRGIVYERHGKSSIDEKLLHVVQNWERLRQGKKLAAILIRDIYDRMSPRGMRGKLNANDEEELSIEDLRRNGGLLRNDVWYNALDKIPTAEVEYIRAARARGEKLGRRPRVVVSTIHGAKGGEASHVILMKEMAHRTYREMERNPEDEARVWYVGCTRSREKLTIVDSSTNRRCPWV